MAHLRARFALIAVLTSQAAAADLAATPGVDLRLGERWSLGSVDVGGTFRFITSRWAF